MDVRWTTTTPDGTVYHYRNGLLHCETGPAVVFRDGSCEWWILGERTLTRPAPAANK